MGTKKSIEILEPYELNGLIDTARDNQTITGIRTAALVAFLYCSGLRISEALAITPKDLYERKDGITSVRINKLKGGRQGWATLMPDNTQAIANWMKLRAELGAQPTDPIFCTISKGKIRTPFQPLSKRNTLTQLKVLGKRAGIRKRIYSHLFRHTHAVTLYTAGAPISAIQDQLNHVHPLTTQKYLRDLGCIDSARVLAGLSWE